MLKTNEKNLVEFLLECKPNYAYANSGFSIDHNGIPFQLPSIGGINLNMAVGDTAFGWEGDHIEPGVSVRCKAEKPNEHPNRSFLVLSCVGNKATIMSGEAKGAEGYVVGQHGGSEHAIIEFDRETKEKMSHEDNIKIIAKGMGLKFTDYPSIKVTSLSPDLVNKMNLAKDAKTGKLIFPVAAIVPSELMGSGIGSTGMHRGDYDIMTSDAKAVKNCGIEKLKFGDFVALKDQDNRFGRTHREGAMTIGIIIHSDCKNGGHGPGVTTLLSCPEGNIEPLLCEKSNIGDYLK